MSRDKKLLDGEAELIARLQKIGSKTTGKRILRRAATRATAPLLREVRARAPRDTGALRRAVKRVVTSRGYSVDARIGVDAGFEQDGRRPTNYVHLVEFGTEHSAAEPFIRSSYDALRDSMRGDYADLIRAGIREA